MVIIILGGEGEGRGGGGGGAEGFLLVAPVARLAHLHVHHVPAPNAAARHANASNAHPNNEKYVMQIGWRDQHLATLLLE